MNKVLEPFVKDVAVLEKGYKFGIQGLPEEMFGTLVGVLADNPASCSFGGFKESCSANLPCCQCKILRSDISRKIHESQCVLRTPEDYDECLTRMEDPLEDRQTVSVQSGLNFKSVLNDLEYFHVCSGGLLPDIFHDVLEGVFPFETNHLLKHLINEEQFFTLDELNCAIRNIELGQLDSLDRPTPISYQTLFHDQAHSLKQQGVQMWVFCRYLPLMIANKVPEDDLKWINFLKLLDISKYLFAPTIDEDDLAVLDVLLTEHHRQFVALYPEERLIPKMHFLLHTPRLIKLFGPLIHHWTACYESKHRYLKQLAARLGNFKNLAFTLATRHQSYQCYLMRENALGSESLEMGPETCPSSSNVEAISNTIHCLKWIRVNGTLYKTDEFVILPEKIEEDLTFGRIVDIVLTETIIFHVQLFNTKDFSEHYNSYIISETQQFRSLPLSELPSYLCLHPNMLLHFPTVLLF